ncbi:MAG TPA: prepilin-type N-terminal cleavage/methylation domain-containing protein [Gemmatimonadales bacterium]|jgi:type IV pilus modification protein PilV|nr:prepilin-type N-terminal cleavage/methylation domain-containing protein [Gemmatimonadales bacterium]
MTDRRGFTIVEVLIAVLVLTVGMLGLVTTAALTTRMIGQGQRYTEASTLASQRFEILRARSCTALADSTETQGAYTVGWTVASADGGKSRVITVTVTSPTGAGTARTDTFTTKRLC